MTVSTAGGRRRSQAEGERLVAEFEAGELGRKAFCAVRSISVSTLDYWRKRVRGHHTAAAAGFVELAPMTDGGELGLEIELDLGGGAVLRIRRVG